MKQLITATASIMLILALLVEVSAVQLFYISIMRADYETVALNEMIRSEGWISDEYKSALGKSLSEILNCSEEVIEISGPEGKVEKGSLICFDVIVRIESDRKSWITDEAIKNYVYKRSYCVVSMAEF